MKALYIAIILIIIIIGALFFFYSWTTNPSQPKNLRSFVPTSELLALGFDRAELTYSEEVPTVTGDPFFVYGYQALVVLSENDNVTFTMMQYNTEDRAHNAFQSAAKITFPEFEAEREGPLIGDETFYMETIQGPKRFGITFRKGDIMAGTWNMGPSMTLEKATEIAQLFARKISLSEINL